jgi:osmotically inducible lipoprotein OsmB
MKSVSSIFAGSLAIAGLLAMTACSGMSTAQQRTLSGAGIGAGVGAVGTAATGGCITCGAAVGAAVGAGAGYVYDRSHR